MKKILSKENLTYLGIFLVVIACLPYFWGLWRFFDFSDKLSDLSALGDWSGGITAPLVSLAGFVMIYLSFREQSDAFERSQQEAHFQNYEQTFYRLLENYRNIVNQLQFANLDNPDPEFFSSWVGDFQRSVKDDTSYGNLVDKFNRYAERGQKVDFFVRNVLFFLNFLNKRKSPEANQLTFDQNYLGLFATQMDDNEISMLFYRLICKQDALALRGREICRALSFFEKLDQRKFYLHEDHLDLL